MPSEGVNLVNMLEPDEEGQNTSVTDKIIQLGKYAEPDFWEQMRLMMNIDVHVVASLSPRQAMRYDSEHVKQWRQKWGRVIQG
ncbi:hypothetical protein ACM66B_006060 [Microbotryomycetes sp. NB124-2]